MDKEIDKKLERMVLENTYDKTLTFSDSRCSKCVNSLSGVCSLHHRDKLNMLKEIAIKNIPESDKKKNKIDVMLEPNSKIKFFSTNIIKPEELDYNSKENLNTNKKKIKSRCNLNNLVDITGKKCNDVSEMEFSFDDVFE